MIQRFIELGEGYSDIYELVELAKSNKHRILHVMAFHTVINNRDVTSPVLILKPSPLGDFLPMYICREGIPNPNVKANKRFDLFRETAEELGKEIIEIEVKSSNQFAEKELYYQHIIGILRMNRYIPQLS